MTRPTHLLFVCLGNICRSPTAEGIFTSMARDRSLNEQLYIDSAGTANYHTGSPPDSRAISAATQRGYDISTLRARPIKPADFDIFDYILAMDRHNLTDLECMAPRHFRGYISLVLDFDSTQPKNSEVPDPYFAGPSGFNQVIDMLERACQGLLEHLVQTRY